MKAAPLLGAVAALLCLAACDPYSRLDADIPTDEEIAAACGPRVLGKYVQDPVTKQVELVDPYADCRQNLLEKKTAMVDKWHEDHPIATGISNVVNAPAQPDVAVPSTTNFYDNKGNRVGTVNVHSDGSASYFGRDGSAISTP